VKAYPKYKDSGIEWLGEVPEEWATKRLGYITKCLDGFRIPINAENRSYIQGEYPYWGANGVVDYVESYLFDEELVLLGEDGAPFFEDYKTVSFHVNGKIWVNNHAHVLQPNMCKARFLTYCLNDTDYSHFIDGSTRDKLTQSAMRSIPITFPSNHEQQAIASFLDRETSRIDALIQKKERMIELLKEKRIALITQAVTKGLDPNVPMKDSGIGWLGEVPKHWELLRIRNIVKPGNQGIKIGPFGSQIRSDILVETGYKIYGQENVINDDFSLGDRYIDEQTYRELFVCEIVPGDLLITMMGSSGQCKVLPEGYPIGIMDSHLIRLRTNSKVDTKYLELVIGSSVYAQHQIRLASKGSIMSGMNSSIIKDLLILVPSPIEQKQIRAKVEKWMAKIDSLVKEITKTISLLREYRASLIHHAVTGKIDLRGYDAQAQ